jgi:hypothetical protein
MTMEKKWKGTKKKITRTREERKGTKKKLLKLQRKRK